MKMLIALCALFTTACATPTVLTPGSQDLILQIVQAATVAALTGKGGYTNSACSLLSTVQPTTLAPCSQAGPTPTAEEFIACATQAALYVEFFKLQQRLCPPLVATTTGGK